MAKNEPISVENVRKQLRERLAFLEEQITPLAAEAEEIRDMLGEGRTGAPSEVRAAVLNAVRERPGLAGAEYDAILHVAEGIALRHLKALEADGRVRREGQRRGTRWFPADQR